MCRHAGLRAAAMNGAHTAAFNGIIGNSVLPQCFNVLLGPLTHRSPSLQEEIRNQYVLPIGPSKKAGRERDHKDRRRQRPTEKSNS